MPFTPNQNRLFSDSAYGVAPNGTTTLQKNFHPKQGHDYLLDPQNRNGGKYRVLETQNDPQTGFQAMAVAP